MNPNKQHINYFNKTYNYRARGSGYNRRFNNYFYRNNRRYNNFRRVPHESHLSYRRRSPSPKLGSEEHTQRKIQQTSKQIMEHLFNPIQNPIKTVIDSTINDKPTSKSEQKVSPQENKMPPKKTNKATTIDIKEIHRKIINHITNLNDGRKRNLINSTISGYDIAIQQIQKQKRLEISRALRNFCNKENEKESSEYINSIIPDIGISIEDVPKNLIEELSKQLDLEFENEDFEVKQDDNGTAEENLFNVRNELDELLPSSPEDGYNCIEDNTTDNFRVIHLLNNGLENIVESSSNSEKSNIESTSNVDAQTQTITTVYNSVSTQVAADLLGNPTDVLKTTISLLIKQCKDKKKYSLNDCLCIMNDVDESVKMLTEYRQFVFSHLKSDTTPVTTTTTTKTKTPAQNPAPNKRGRKRKKIKTPPKETSNEKDKEPPICLQTRSSKRAKNDLTNLQEHESNLKESYSSVTVAKDNNLSNSVSISDHLTDSQVPHSLAVTNDEKSESNTEPEDYLIEISDDEEVLKQKVKQTERYVIPTNGKIVVIKIIQNEIIAASEYGILYIFNNSTCQKITEIKVSETTLTAIENYSTSSGDILLFVSSIEAPLKTINFKTKLLTNVAFSETNEQVQCMEVSWGYVFLGCFNGNLLRYNIIRERFEFTASVANDVIYALKATSEGARKVLIVASRNSPISIRDAMSGLYMRVMNSETNYITIYSLLMKNDVLYCGTVGHDIVMHSFYDGHFIGRLKGGSADTINCLKLMKNLLFASSKANGNIYIFDIRTRYLLNVIRKLNTLILSMDVTKDRIIIGTMSKQIISIAMPENLMQYL